MSPSPYLAGVAALLFVWVLSYLFTHNISPFALAVGNNKQVSASLLQFWIFTLVTVFAYTTVFAARFIQSGPSAPVPALPDIPVNLLILMGLSVVTASASKGITISKLNNNELGGDDNSSATLGRDGNTDLTKVQMIIWTFIAATIYIIRLVHFISAKEYNQTLALPDIDGALLVLMGASQGGYIGNKLVSRDVAEPDIEKVVPSSAAPDEEVCLFGSFFDDSKDGNALLTKDESDREDVVPAEDILEWTDTKIRFKVPDEFRPGMRVRLNVRANSQTSDDLVELTIIEKEDDHYTVPGTLSPAPPTPPITPTH